MNTFQLPISGFYSPYSNKQAYQYGAKVTTSQLRSQLRNYVYAAQERPVLIMHRGSIPRAVLVSYEYYLNSVYAVESLYSPYAQPCERVGANKEPVTAR